MRCVSRTSFLTSLLVAVFLLEAGSPALGQGFGWRKKKLRLELKHPPKIYLVRTSFSVVVTQGMAVGANVRQQAKQYIEALLPEYDRRLRPVADRPETTISLDISELKVASKRESRSTTEYQQIGSTTVHNSETGMAETAPVYGNVTRHSDVTVVDGRIAARYECRDAMSGRVIDSAPLTWTDWSEHEAAPADFGVFEGRLLRGLASAVGSRFAATPEGGWVVLLPKGKLSKASDLLNRGSWNSALEELSRMRPLKKPADEAYRQYAFGIAHEGLAYEDSDAGNTFHFLQLSERNYDDAVRRNPSILEFRQAHSRVAGLVSSYKRLEREFAAYEARRFTGGSTISPHAAGRSALRNEDILQWLKSGVPEKEVLAEIKRRPRSSFDLTRQGAQALAQGGASARVIDAMRDSMRPRRQSRASDLRWVAALAVIGAYLLPVLFTKF